MKHNSETQIQKWNETLIEIIERIDWYYFELDDKSQKLLDVKDYRNYPISTSMAQLRIFLFKLRDEVNKDILKEILKLVYKYDKYKEYSMKTIIEDIMNFYIIDLSILINQIYDYMLSK